MNIPRLEDTDLTQKNVIIRADLDVKVVEGRITNDFRIQSFLPSLNTVIEKGCRKILIISHLGRPEGEFDTNLTLKPVYDYMLKNYSPRITFVEHKPFNLFYLIHDAFFRSQHQIVLLDNLRFWKEEQENDSTFAQELAYLADAYINEAFAASHRKHASIVALPQAIKQITASSVAFGTRFAREVDNLSLIFDFPKKPVVTIISGAKEDKLAFIDGFKRFSDKILVAGRLPEYMPDDPGDARILVARLTPDKEDITLHSIEQFEREIVQAKTIVVSGPPSKFEDPSRRMGTERILRSIAANSLAFKVAGGGDTIRAISALRLENAFNWLSTGGGAMLEFLAQGTLPGLAALLN